MSSTETYTTSVAADVAPSTNNIESLDVQDFNNESLQHPLLVRPSGNALTSDDDLRPSMGLFGRLPDDMVLALLEFLDQKALTNLGSTCRGLFAYTTYDQLWRDIAIEEPDLRFEWRGSWRASLRRLPSPNLPKIDCSDLFSDALHRPFRCSQIELPQYTLGIPRSNRIPRLADLTTAEFNNVWTNRPFILTEPIKNWPVYQTWSQDELAKRYAETIFRAEALEWPLKTYLRYMASTKDESPLYLFDRGFVEKMHLVVGSEGEYQPPDCFQEDLFTVLGDERPDHRWLIIGPERSGSTFHKDPNATSAWNAVIRGSKYWILFPPSMVPPGVYISDDQGEVTSPFSIAEWLLEFHAEARQVPGCLEGVCQEGEVLHVPSGWWHLVVNLESAVAITQNFVPRSHTNSVVDFLRRKANQVSGFRHEVENPFQLFVARLKQRYPEMVVELEETNKKRKWEDIVGKADEDGSGQGGFSFGLGEDLEDDD